MQEFIEKKMRKFSREWQKKFVWKLFVFCVQSAGALNDVCFLLKWGIWRLALLIWVQIFQLAEIDALHTSVKHCRKGVQSALLIGKTSHSSQSKRTFRFLCCAYESFGTDSLLPVRNPSNYELRFSSRSSECVWTINKVVN